MPWLLAPVLVGAFLAGPAEARWQVFTSAANALASNVVVTISEARDGALWIGTPQGLNRFDGARWQTWRDSLPGPSVSCVLRDRAGRVWVGTDGGVTRWDGQTWWRPDATDPEQPRGQAQSVIEDHTGEIWIGTTLGLFRYQPALARWTAIPTAMLRDRNVSQLFEDSRRRIWVGSPRGALVVDSNRVVFTPLDRDPAKPDSLAAIGEDGSGGIWFGTPLGAFRWDGSAWSGYGTPQGLPSDTVYAFATDRHGRIWIGTADGVARFDGRTFHRELETAPSQRIGIVLSLIVDRVGNLWVGTARSGMLRSDGVDIHRYYASGTTSCVVPTPVVPFESVLGSGCRTPMLQDRAGDLWFASRESVLDRFSRDGATWSQLRPGPGVLVPTAVNVMLEDAGDSLWLGSRTQGLAVLDPTRAIWTTYRIADGLPSDSIATILEDNAGDVWAGTANGLARRSAGTWSSFLDAGIDGVPVRVTQIVEDGGHTLWLRTSAGLWSFDPTRQVLTPHGPATGLPDAAIASLAVSPAGELWAGSAHGVSRRSGAGWDVRDAAALGDSLVSLIAFDDGGRLWAVLENSVLVRSPSGAWAPPDGFVPFASGGFRPRQVLEDENGLHWFASASGLGSWAGETWRFFGTAAGLATTQADRLLEDSQGRLWASAFGGITRWAAVTATYAATGGTVAADGLYTAGGSAGSFRVIATVSGGTLADTSTVSVTSVAGRTYTTNFSSTENPISEGGNWINGGTLGLDWTNVSSASGLAIGHQAKISYTDATALLTGAWGPDQQVTATVHTVNQKPACYQEVEMRLRSTISAHVNTGYEISFHAVQDNSAYLIIVKWNGPVGSYQYIANLNGSQYALRDGDVVSAKLVGNVITVYRNGAQMAQATDNTYTSGAPGMGFNLEGGNAGCAGTNGDYGYTSFTATDGVH